MERPVFTIEGETYSWADVISYARLSGEWESLEREARHGLACVRRLTASGADLDDQDFVDATVAFRYERNLLSGEELEEWLRRWQVELPEWGDYVRRRLLRERWAEELGDSSARCAVAENEVGAVLWAEGVCSGFLEEFALRFASDAALAVESGEILAGEREEALPRIQTAAERARAEVSTALAIAHEVDTHTLEWLRIEGQVLELPGEDLAREAALSVREDGRALEEVAGECGVPPRPLAVYMGEIAGELASSLLAAQEGELVGPLAANGSFVLVLVRAKVYPEPDDPDIQRMAVRRLTEQAVARAVAANVEWHERL